ncbi:MAG: porin family protein [Colwellia sp.]|nr:porin family protein [Colwellia sp.]MCW8864446.1 porin family protein [Colwellia sp.]
MKKTILLALTILTSTYVSPILATENNSWYIGGVYTAQKISLPSAGRDFNTVGIVAGYQYNNYLSLETRFSKGTSGNTFNYDFRDFPDEGVDTDIDYQVSVLIKASYPINEKFDVYVTTGYSKTKIEQEILDSIVNAEGLLIGVNTSNFTFTESGLTYGLGLKYNVTNSVNLFVDYQILPNWEPFSTNSESWDSINVGFNYEF